MFVFELLISCPTRRNQWIFLYLSFVNFLSSKKSVSCWLINKSSAQSMKILFAMLSSKKKPETTTRCLFVPFFATGTKYVVYYHVMDTYIRSFLFVSPDSRAFFRQTQREWNTNEQQHKDIYPFTI